MDNLPSDGFLHVERYTTHTNLLKRKGVYPYEYVDSPARLEDTHLPPKSSFFSRLMDTDIPDVDYAHAQNAWTTLQMNTLGDYHDLYLKYDVLLLADVFEQFRATCMSYYGLDPAQYYTAPRLSCGAMLKITGVTRATDPDMHLFVESGIRVGVSMIFGRHAVANNSYFPDYDPAKPTSHIVYLDANNLYGWG